MYITWHRHYETGHPLIDAEHKLLVFLFKRLDAAIKTGQPAGRLSRIIAEVRKFVEFHFVSEENLMEETGFRDMASHRKMHAALLLELDTKIASVGSARADAADLVYFLNRWLVEHIGAHDREVAVHATHSGDRPVAELFYLEYFAAPSAA